MPRRRGIPEDHPSVGKDVREPVEGPSWPQEKDHGGGRMITRWHELVWGIVLAVWVIYSRLAFISPYFKDPDAAKMAFGVAQRLQGTPYSEGIFYQIEKTFGSYLIFEFLARIFHVDIADLGHFMAITCAVFMIGILVLSYHLGVLIWGYRVGLVSVTVLALSPMMWITGEYPTSLVPALFFFMLAVWTMIMSYRIKGGRWWLVASAILFAWAIIVRLDMALGMLAPICYALFVDRRGLRRTIILYAITIAILAVFWLGSGVPLAEILHTGPHRPDYPKSLLLNWWGMGPFLFVFAFAGFVYRFVTDQKPLPFIFFWIVGFNTFYTGHLYSPHYFIAYYPVVSWLAAFSIIALYGWLVRLVKYNRPMRFVFMLLFVCGALSMLTISTIKECDGRTRLAWGETITYARNHGLHPTGSVWFYMQDFRQGRGFQYGWIEDGARRMADELLNPESETFADNQAPVCVGSESQVYLNYYLLANGWRYESSRGPFLNFNNISQPAFLQTVYVGDEPIPELGFLTNPIGVSVYIGRDALPRLVDQEGEVGAPTLTALGGWHVAHSFNGLDILASGYGGSKVDGTVNCERELHRFFHLDPLPKMHVELIPSENSNEYPGGKVVSHDGNIMQDRRGQYLAHISELEWVIHPQPDRWLALVINRSGLLPGYRIYIDGEKIENAIELAKNIPGFLNTQWDIFLIPPEYITSSTLEFMLETDTHGHVYDIYWSQRTYPDCQFRNEVAKPLELEFQDISCIQ